MHFYTQQEIEFLKEITPGKSNKEITKLFNKKFNLNLSEKAIAATRKRHKIKTGSDGRFEQGNVPFNKGTKGLTGANKTSFKKGNKSHNWVPIGSERVTKDDYIQIKVQEGKFQHNWKGKHILIYEEHNGPVPKGHNVIFGDGNNRNFDIDNLVLVTKAQMLFLNRHSLIKNSAEITKIGIAVADIDRKINQKRKGKE